MPKKATKSAAETAVVDDSATAVVNDVIDDNKDKKNIRVKTSEVANMNITETPLLDSDEVEVVSLISNVSYKDPKTNDFYEWDEVGHIEYMTVDTLKTMWRNHKGYFRNLWLKPNDDRVIKLFGLTKIFEEYLFLMNDSNYTRNNIAKICAVIKATPNGLKHSVCNKARAMVASGKLADLNVIRALDRELGLDLISSL